MKKIENMGGLIIPPRNGIKQKFFFQKSCVSVSLRTDLCVEALAHLNAAVGDGDGGVEGKDGDLGWKLCSQCHLTIFLITDMT